MLPLMCKFPPASTESVFSADGLLRTVPLFRIKPPPLIIVRLFSTFQVPPVSVLIPENTETAVPIENGVLPEILPVLSQFTVPEKLQVPLIVALDLKVCVPLPVTVDPAFIVRVLDAVISPIIVFALTPPFEKVRPKNVAPWFISIV